MSYNPLFGLHVRLLGSWRQQVIVLCVLFGGVMALASVIYSMSKPAEHGQISATWLGFVTFAQCIFALFVAPGAIRRAVQRDFDTGMLESHRIAPMSGFKIVRGYLTGPPVQAALLFCANLLVGTYFAVQMAASFGGGLLTTILGGWYVFQICLVFLAIAVATLVLLVALASAGKTNIMGLVVGVGVGGLLVTTFVPGLALVTGILSGTEFIQSLIGQMGPIRAPSDPMVVVVAPLVQLAFSTVFVIAACRKVRAPERAMFTLPLALAMLAIWGATLVAGMHFMPAGHWVRRSFDDLATPQVITSTIAFMLMALFAIVAAASDALRAARAASFGERARDVHPWVPPLTPVVLALLSMGVASLLYQAVAMPEALNAELAGAFQSPTALAMMFAAMLFAFWTDYNLVFVSLAGGGRAFRAIVLWGLVLKLLPIATDLGLAALRRAATMDDGVDLSRGLFTGISPFGTLMLLCVRDGHPVPGLIVQFGIALGATYLGNRARERAARPPVPPVRPMTGQPATAAV